MAQSFGLKNIVVRTANRRAFIGGMLAATGMAAGAVKRAGAEATPVASPISGAGDGRYLFVGDRTRDTVSLYSIPDFSPAGTIEGVTFGTHAGALLLPDGRLIFADTGNDQIVALSVTNGTAEIRQQVSADLGGAVAWMAASPTLSHLAVGSLMEDSETQFLNIVDLETFENVSLEFVMNEPEEITAWLLHDPLHLYVAVGGQIHSYRLDDLIAGNQEPLSTVEVELGSHGGATDPLNGRLFYTTAPGTGFEVLETGDGAAAYATQIPWDLDGLAGGRNARPRVTADGRHIFGLMSPGLDDPTEWASAVVSNHVTDMAGLSAVRIEIGAGNFGYRWGLSDRYALWAGYDADGGTVYLLDADAASETFGALIATMPVALPSNAAVPGEDVTGTDTYATAITADGKFGFVSINGDQVVKVFDLDQQIEIAEIPIDLPLRGYDGYITVIEPGITPVDLWGR